MEKVFTLVTCLIVLFLNQSVAQKKLVDFLMMGTTQILYSGGGSASGVIVGDSNNIYLVTAAHCIVDNFSAKTMSLMDTLVTLIHYEGDPFEVKPDTLKVNLLKLGGIGNILVHQKQDIAVVAIAKVSSLLGTGQTTRSIYNYYVGVDKITSKATSGIDAKFLVPLNKVGVGDDCYIFGFPTSLHAVAYPYYDFSRPLIRKGAIAGKSKDKGTIIVDCPVYKGNSGGPVFSIADDENHGLIGIVSASVLLKEVIVNRYYGSENSNYLNSGYSIVVPIDFALELMKAHYSNQINLGSPTTTTK